jgi:hypothetical protein
MSGGALATADRIFVALRNETRTQRIGNEEISQLLQLAEALANALAKRSGGEARETHIVARACAALDAHQAATGNLRIAIARVRAGIDDLLR